MEQHDILESTLHSTRCSIAKRKVVLPFSLLFYTINRKASPVKAFSNSDMDTKEVLQRLPRDTHGRHLKGLCTFSKYWSVFFWQHKIWKMAILFIHILFSEPPMEIPHKSLRNIYIFVFVTMDKRMLENMCNKTWCTRSIPMHKKFSIHYGQWQHWFSHIHTHKIFLVKCNHMKTQLYIGHPT